MTLPERGLYRELLDESWLKGPIPSNADDIAELLGMDVLEIEHLLPAVLRCFEIDQDGLMHSPFMESIRGEADAARLAQAARRLGKTKTLGGRNVSEPPLSTDNHGKPIEERKREKNREEQMESPVGDSCPEPDDPAPAPPASPVLFLAPCKGTMPKEWPLTQAKLDEWIEAFPGIDVRSELRKAIQWLRDNPSRGKTARGMSAYFGNWLTRAQDRVRPMAGAPLRPPAKPNHRATADEAYRAQLLADERARSERDAGEVSGEVTL